MIVASFDSFVFNVLNGNIHMDSRPDDTFVAVYQGRDIATFRQEGKTFVGEYLGKPIQASELLADRYASPAVESFSPAAIALALVSHIPDLIKWEKDNKTNLTTELIGHKVIVSRDGEMVAEAELAELYGIKHLPGWKAKVFGRGITQNPRDRINRILDEIVEKVKKTGEPEYFLRESDTGRFYRSYGIPEASSKAYDKAFKALHNDHRTKIDALKKTHGPEPFRQRVQYYTALEALERQFSDDSHALLIQYNMAAPSFIFNMNPPEKGASGAKKFKRFADAKMHMLYLVGHFVPDRSYSDGDWPADYVDVPEFLYNSNPVKIPENFEIVSVASKGATPQVVMTSEEIKVWLDRHCRLKVLTDKYGAVVKTVFSKLETTGKISAFPYVLLIGDDDKGEIDAAVKTFNIDKKTIMKVKGKENYDGERKIAVAAADAATAFLLRSALGNIPMRVLNMIELTETVSA